MDAHKLRIFCKVVELKSFTHAAKSVNLSQPSVSEHIRSLETQLGQALIERKGRKAEATPAGKILYQYGRQILKLMKEADQNIQNLLSAVGGPLTIGASSIPGNYLLPHWLGGFKELHPTIEPLLTISNSGEVVKLVTEGELEFGIVGAKWEDSSLDWELLVADELVLVVQPGHPFARMNAVPIEALEGQDFVMREAQSGTRQMISRILKEHGFDPFRLKVVAQMGSTEALKQSIKARLGISILSRRSLSDELIQGALVAVPLQNLEMKRSFYLVQKTYNRLSPLAQMFIDHIREKAKEG